MRTNIEIDDRLMAEAMESLTCRTKKETRGIRDTSRKVRIERSLLAFPQRDLASRQTLLKSADNYRALRARGFTVRSVVDCIIATYCIEHRLPLLHSDRDFDPFEEHLGLRVIR